MKRNFTNLKLDRRLGSYLTLGVGAGVLGSQASNAAIVYWDVTPLTITDETNDTVRINPLTGEIATGVSLDTPTIGLRFTNVNYIYSLTEFSSSPESPRIAYGDNNRIIRFASGATIDVASSFKTNWSYMDRPGWTTADSGWATGEDGTSGFLGFTFDNAGTTNYGWLAVTYNAESQTLEIGDFAYEDSGAGILAGAIPEPSSLGLLALGASGLLARRRRQAA
jgi:hypothetical protein